MSFTGNPGYIDSTKEPPNQEELTDDKELINESIDINPPCGCKGNLLVFHLINSNNVIDIIAGYEN